MQSIFIPGGDEDVVYKETKRGLCSVTLPENLRQQQKLKADNVFGKKHWFNEKTCVIYILLPSRILQSMC